MNRLAENEEFIEYICPNAPEKCGGISQISQKIEVKPVRLLPPSSATSRAKGESFCVVTPARKGKQFPTLIFAAFPDSVDLVADDWDSGLKVIPKVRNGMYIIEGRSITGPGELEIYRLKWDKRNYREYSRKCYRVRAATGNGPDQLIAVPCQ